MSDTLLDLPETPDEVDQQPRSFFGFGPLDMSSKNDDRRLCGTTERKDDPVYNALAHFPRR